MNAAERKAWGPVIKLARQVRGLTQVEVADKAEISLPTLRGMEKARNAPQEEVLNRVLQALGLIDDLAQPDVTEFLNRLRPLLGRIDSDTRARLMPAIVSMVAKAIEAYDVASDGRVALSADEALQQQERAQAVLEGDAWDRSLKAAQQTKGIDVDHLAETVTVELETPAEADELAAKRVTKTATPRAQKTAARKPRKPKGS